MTRVLAPVDAAALLSRGGVLAYPTEGVWGLGCNPRDETAVLRVLGIKQRRVDQGLILIASQLDQLRPYLDIATLPAQRLAAVLGTWPGPHTWIMPASAEAPHWITGDHAGIAVRISAHPVVVELCDAFAGAVVSTSANFSGQPAAQGRDDLDPALLAAVDGICAGETGGLAAPSSIRDALTGATLRR